MSQANTAPGFVPRVGATKACEPRNCHHDPAWVARTSSSRRWSSIWASRVGSSASWRIAPRNARGIG
eukprot:1135320-Pyramimonas_sp.AAC.1